jgi:hemoglobin-like flavoprotein
MPKCSQETVAMDQNTKDLVRTSWSKLTWNSPLLVERFHVHLFNVDPEAQMVFSAENLNRVTGIMRFFDVAVGLLDEFELLEKVILDFGRKHNSFGVVDSHYAGFGDALQRTIGEAMGDEFTLEMQFAWAEFYQNIADRMVRGAIAQGGSTPELQNHS